MTSPAPNGTTGPVQVAIKSQPPGISSQHFTYQVSGLPGAQGRVGGRARKGRRLMRMSSWVCGEQEAPLQCLGGKPRHVSGGGQPGQSGARSSREVLPWAFGGTVSQAGRLGQERWGQGQVLLDPCSAPRRQLDFRVQSSRSGAASCGVEEAVPRERDWQ